MSQQFTEPMSAYHVQKLVLPNVLEKSQTIMPPNMEWRAWRWWRDLDIFRIIQRVRMAKLFAYRAFRRDPWDSGINFYNLIGLCIYLHNLWQLISSRMTSIYHWAKSRWACFVVLLSGLTEEHWMQVLLYWCIGVLWRITLGGIFLRSWDERENSGLTSEEPLASYLMFQGPCLQSPVEHILARKHEYKPFSFSLAQKVSSKLQQEVGNRRSPNFHNSFLPPSSNCTGKLTALQPFFSSGAKNSRLWLPSLNGQDLAWPAGEQESLLHSHLVKSSILLRTRWPGHQKESKAEKGHWGEERVEKRSSWQVKAKCRDTWKTRVKSLRASQQAKVKRIFSPSLSLHPH